MQLEQTNILIHRAVAGDRDALGELLARHHAYLSMLASGQLHHRMQSKADASDLVQETYLVVQNQILTFRGATDSEFASWLRSILVRVFAQHNKGSIDPEQFKQQSVVSAELFIEEKSFN